MKHAEAKGANFTLHLDQEEEAQIRGPKTPVRFVAAAYTRTHDENLRVSSLHIRTWTDRFMAVSMNWGSIGSTLESPIIGNSHMGTWTPRAICWVKV